MKFRDYKLVKGITLNVLEASVGELLLEGWELYGNIFEDPLGRATVQPMVLPNMESRSKERQTSMIRATLGNLMPASRGNYSNLAMGLYDSGMRLTDGDS